MRPGSEDATDGARIPAGPWIQPTREVSVPWSAGGVGGEEFSGLLDEAAERARRILGKHGDDPDRLDDPLLERAAPPTAARGQVHQP